MNPGITIFLITLLLSLLSPCLRASEGEDDARIRQLESRVRELERQVEKLLNHLAGFEAARTITAGTSVVSPSSQRRAEDSMGSNAASVVSDSQAAALSVHWEEGLVMESASGDLSFQIGGRVENDWAFFAGDDLRNRPFREGTLFRRARLRLEGTIHHELDYKLEYDFGGFLVDPPGYADVYVGFSDTPYLGQLRVGHLKEPIGLERQTSARFLAFMERSLPSILMPVRNSGIRVDNSAVDDRLSWSFGAYKDSGTRGTGLGSGGVNFTSRVTVLPLASSDNTAFLHLGAGYSLQNPRFEAVRLAQRPESSLAPVLLDTGGFDSGSHHVFNLESALVRGPLTIQAEYTGAFFNRSDLPDVTFQGGYLQASFLLTGEQRAYSKKGGIFGRLRPKRNFLADSGGSGAWEMAARVSHLDLEDRDIRGGRMTNFTFGVNWYLNPHARVLWNYVFADLENHGQTNIFQTRIQLDF